MSTAQFTCPLITVIPGQVIAASLWNGEFVNLFTNINPLGVGAYSDTDPQMQTQTDPFPSGSTSRPTSMGGEIERLRFILAEITGNTYWYQVPTSTLISVATNITALQARFPIQTVDIGDLQVTTGKLALLAVTAAQIANNTITAAKVANATITETQLSTSIAGNGLSGGAGTALTVNVDSATIEINSDTLRVKDAGITAAKLASGIIFSPKTNVSSLIQANSVNGVYGTAFSLTSAGTLKGIFLKSSRPGGTSGTATFSIRITLDGVSYVVGSLISNNSNSYAIVSAIWTGSAPPTLANYFTSSTAFGIGVGTGSDIYYGFKSSLLIEIEANSFTDGNNGFYVATSYES